MTDTLKFMAVMALVFHHGGRVFAAEMRIDDDGMAIVDGRRVFILGMYEYPKEDAVLEQVRDAGVNLVQVSHSTEELDRLHRNGIWAWTNTGYAIDLSVDPDARREALDRMVAQLAGHPAFLVWEVPDEALWNCWYAAIIWRLREEEGQLRERIAALEDVGLREDLLHILQQSRRDYDAARFADGEAKADSLWRALGMEPPRPGLNLSNAQERAERMAAGMLEGYRHLRRLDPRHPVWMNHAPRNDLDQLALFGKAADIVGCDIYPVPKSAALSHSDIPDQSPSAVGAYTARMQRSAPGKPVWMVLQGFGWRDIQDHHSECHRAELRRPTHAETRFMAYNAIVHGARGILYWGTMAVEKDSVFWRELLTVLAELAALQPVLSAPDAAWRPNIAISPSWGSGERGVLVLPKQVAGKTWLIVVNESHNPLAFTLSGMDMLEGITYRDTKDAISGTVSEGALALTMGAYAVLVLEPQAPQ